MSNLHFNHYRKGVVCLDYSIIYESATLASQATGCYRTSIVKCCKGERKSCYNHKSVKLRWMYLKDYVERYGLERTLELQYYDKDDFLEEYYNAKSKVQGY